MALTAGLTLGLDQLSKVWIVHLLDLKDLGQIDLLPPFLVFRMAWNPGVNFGLLASNAEAARWLLIGVAVAISAGVAFWVRRGRMRPLAQVAGGLLIGGALANVIDRLAYGAVADFLNMSCCGIHNPWSFNIADVAVFAGAVGLALFAGEKRGQETS
jgi:signal peptidase II